MYTRRRPESSAFPRIPHQVVQLCGASPVIALNGWGRSRAQAVESQIDPRRMLVYINCLQNSHRLMN
jgi:hypothetical protein